MKIKRFQLYAYNDLALCNSSKCKIGSYDHVFEAIDAISQVTYEFIDLYDIHEGTVMHIDENSFFRQAL